MACKCMRVCGVMEYVACVRSVCGVSVGVCGYG